jgi:predicted GNAT family N-acyltransferase
MPTIRAYQPSDYEQVVALFDSNCPPYFAPEEKELFTNFLKINEQPYFVIVENEQLLAAGGYAYEHRAGRDVAVFTWGMVSQSAHKQGLGKLLTQHRLACIEKDARGLPAILGTSQYTAAFYQKMGFTTYNIVPYGLSKGLDLVEMEKFF